MLVPKVQAFHGGQIRAFSTVARHFDVSGRRRPIRRRSRQGQHGRRRWQAFALICFLHCCSDALPRARSVLQPRVHFSAIVEKLKSAGQKGVSLQEAEQQRLPVSHCSCSVAVLSTLHCRDLI